MDPTLLATLSGVLAGATGEAGASAFEALAALVRDALRRVDRPEAESAALLADPGSADAAAIAELLLAAGERDPAFAQALARWAEDAGPAAGAAVSNSVSGSVGGSVVQGRDFQGDVHIG